MDIHTPKKRWLYRFLQTIILVARGFKDQVLVVRANSLSFALLFAFIPMLALIYAIARGFGFEETVQHTISSSFLAEANVAPVLLEWIERYSETLTVPGDYATFPEGIERKMSYVNHSKNLLNVQIYEKICYVC